MARLDYFSRSAAEPAALAALRNQELTEYAEEQGLLKGAQIKDPVRGVEHEFGRMRMRVGNFDWLMRIYSAPSLGALRQLRCSYN